ncbi:MAG: LuxR C-terminal-related transcriptional regulator [Acidobacteriota bacterium]
MQFGSRKGILENKLAEREKQVVKLLADGYSNEEVGNTLEISRRTVESYRARVMMKLQIGDLPGLVKYAIRSGLTSVQQHRSYQVKRTVAKEILEQQSSL